MKTYRKFQLMFIPLLVAVAMIIPLIKPSTTEALSINPGGSNIIIAATNTCKSNTFFGLIPWYQYLKVGPDQSGKCAVNIDLWSNGNSNTSNLNAIWLIGLAIFDDLLRVAGMVAVGFIIYGGIRYMTSQGEPETTNAARGTIINALIGLAIAVIAATTVSFIGNSLGG